MIPLLDDYDWRQAFGYAGEPGTDANRVDLRQGSPSANVSLAPFTREDVAHIAAMSPGVNDELSWLMVGRLTDGRWFYLEAGCDYTGWDCQAGGCATLASSLPDCLQWCLTDEARSRLGAQLNAKETA